MKAIKVILIVVTLLLAFCIIASYYLSKRDTAHLIEQMKSAFSTNELNALNEWSLEIRREHRAGKVNNMLDSDELPPFIGDVVIKGGKPSGAIIFDKYVQLYWGSGHGHWGLYIGDASTLTNMVNAHKLSDTIYVWK